MDTSLPPDHPDSYNQITPRLARETPGCYFPDQHGNRENNAAHYHGTGPEIWEQMEGRIDLLVAGAGTGGTIGGAGRYLKEQDPKIRDHCRGSRGLGVHRPLPREEGSEGWPLQDRGPGRRVPHPHHGVRGGRRHAAGDRPPGLPLRPAPGAGGGHPGRRLQRRGPLGGAARWRSGCRPGTGRTASSPSSPMARAATSAASSTTSGSPPRGSSSRMPRTDDE